MGLQIFWFIVITVLWCGFFVLEGFDFGVGMLHWFVGNNDVDRRVAINTIGPFWDGNEVWLIVAGAGIFAAFPGWYATMFSALYLPLVLILIGLIIRGVAFEYRGKRDSDRWRTTWSMALVVGSALVPLLLGGRPRRPAQRAADQRPAGVHRQLLEPAHRLWAGHRRHHAGAVPAARGDVPDAQDDR